MIVCHKCGTTLIEGQRICPACGTDNSEAARPQESAAQGALAKTVSASAAQARKSSSAPKNALSSTTKAMIAAGVAILFAAGLVFWQVKAGRARTVEITADDMAKIVETFPPQAQAQLADSPEARKELANDLRQLLAIAEEAKTTGIADRPEIQRQLSLSRNARKHRAVQRRRPASLRQILTHFLKSLDRIKSLMSLLPTRWRAIRRQVACPKPRSNS